MKEKNLKLIMELIFIFILPLIFILTCIKVETNYVYDNNGNYQDSNKNLVFDSPLNLTTYDIVSNHIFIGYEVIHEYGVDDNIYTCIIDMYNNYFDRNFYVNVLNFDIISYYGEMGFESFDSNEIKVYSNNAIDVWSSNSTILYNISGVSTGGDWWDNNIILIDVPSFYTYLNDEADYYNMDIDTYYIGEGHFDIYVAKYLDYDSFVESEDMSLIGKIKILFTNYLDFNDSILLDIFLTYTFLWLMMFISWHFLYALFDFVAHLLKIPIKRRE